MRNSLYVTTDQKVVDSSSSGRAIEAPCSGAARRMDSVLDILKDMHPDAFERLAMRLLREAGFVISKYHLRNQIAELEVWSSIRVVALIQGIFRRGFPKPRPGGCTADVYASTGRVQAARGRKMVRNNE